MATFTFDQGEAAAPTFLASDGTNTVTYQPRLVAFQSVIPTAAGLTTGTIKGPIAGVGEIYCDVVSAGANDIVILPAPTVGTRVILQGNATGYELRSNSPTTVGINGGTGADAESAIAASLLVECRCNTTTTWICNNYSAAGTEAAEEAAA